MDKMTAMATRSLSPPLPCSFGLHHHRYSRRPSRSRGGKAAPAAQYSPLQSSHSLSPTPGTIQTREARGSDKSRAALEAADAAADRAAAASASGKETLTIESGEADQNCVSATISSARPSSPEVKNDRGSDLGVTLAPPEHDQTGATPEFSVSESPITGKLEEERESCRVQRSLLTRPIPTSSRSVPARGNDHFHRNQGEPPGAAVGSTRATLLQRWLSSQTIDSRHHTSTRSRSIAEGGVSTGTTATVVSAAHAPIPETRTDDDGGCWIGAGVSGSDVAREQAFASMIRHPSTLAVLDTSTLRTTAQAGGYLHGARGKADEEQITNTPARRRLHLQRQAGKRQILPPNASSHVEILRETVGTDGVAAAQAIPTPMPPLPRNNAKMPSRPWPSLTNGSDRAEKEDGDKEDKDQSGGCVAGAAVSAGRHYPMVVEAGHRTESQQQGLDDEQPRVIYVGFIAPHPTTVLPDSSRRLVSVPIHVQDVRAGTAAGPRTGAATGTRGDKSNLPSSPSTPLASTSDGHAFEASAQARIAGNQAVRVREREREREIDESKTKVRVNLRVGIAFAMAACGVAGIAVGVAALCEKR